MPVYDLVSNWAYMAAVAWNIKSWFAMMMHLKADRRKYAAMEFRRFVREMILQPCHAGPGAPCCGSSAGIPPPTGCSASGTRSNGPASADASRFIRLDHSRTIGPPGGVCPCARNVPEIPRGHPEIPRRTTLTSPPNASRPAIKPMTLRRLGHTLRKTSTRLFWA